MVNMTEIILWLSHNQECWYKRMRRSLQIYDEGFLEDGKYMSSEILEKEIETEKHHIGL